MHARDGPAAEVERGGERRERERGAELADEEEEEAEAGVLDHVPGHELGLPATGMSNGVGVSSAWAATRNRKNPTNCVRMYGFPKKSIPNIVPFGCASTIPCRFIVPAWTTTPTTASSSGSSYAMSCAAARSAPISANLFALAQPAMSMPMTESDDTARVEHADVEVAHDESRAGGDHEEDQERRDDDDRRREREDSPVRLPRHDVLLLEELDAVAHELEPAVEAAGIHRPEPALHVAHHLQQERVPEDEGSRMG